MLILLGLFLLAVLPLTRITPNQLAWARDRWILGVLICALFFVAMVEPFLVLIAIPPLVKWKGPEELPGVIVYAAIIGEWLVVSALPYQLEPWVPLLLALACIVHAAVIVAQWGRRRPTQGILGQRTHAAGVLVLTMPFMPAAGLAVPLVGLLITQSWLAWIAAGVAMTMMFPWAGFLLVLIGFVLLVPITKVARIPTTYHRPASENTWLDRVSSRGTSIDSVRARLAVNRLLFWNLTWRGLGAGSVDVLLRRYSPTPGHAHCEPLQYVVEYGALGALAILGFAWRVVPFLHLHDPYSAAVVAGAILMLGSTPARIPQLGALWWAECALLTRLI